MISTTYSGTAVFILNEAPDWATRPKATFEAISQTEDSLTGREARRAFGGSLRTRLNYTATATGPAALALSAALRSLQAQPVLVPFWPGVSAWSARGSAPITGGLKIAFKADWSQWELFEGSEPGWPAAGDLWAPVLWGRLDQPEPRWDAGHVASLEVKFIEAGPADFALSPASVSWSAGPGLSGYVTAPRLWPFPIDWATLPESFRFGIVRDAIGFTRAPLEVVYPQTNARAAEFRTYGKSITDTSAILRWFLDHGPGASFWAPTWRAALSMTADLAGGGTALAVESAAGVVAGDFLAFVTAGGVAATARINTISGTTVNLLSAPGAFPASSTLVCPLILARFEKPKLELEWLSLDVVTARVQIAEVPPEYTPAADETLGTTLGALPVRGYLYVMTRSLGGSSVVTRATSFERNLTLSGNTYISRKIDHGELRASLFIDRDEVQISSEIIAGDPITLIATGKSESTTRIEIFAVDVSGSTASNPVQLFAGDILSASIRGSKLTAKAVTGGTVFDRLFPRMRLQIGCNHSLFSAGCTLASSSWKFTATMADPGTAGYPFTFILGSVAKVGGGTPTMGAGYFAGGWAEFGSGANTVKRQILNSTAVVSGVTTITLSKDPAVFPAIGDSVTLYPGCDGAFATCSAKFGNSLNFGGMPFIPSSNPSLVKLATNAGGGKK